MITTAEQYNANLHLIHNSNPPIYAALPNADNIYNIDLEERTVNAPEILGVELDHVAETLYFIVDRNAGYVDLATTSCLITYTNALGKTRFYIVPFYDIYTYKDVDKMVFPWCLDANVLEAPGIVEFSIQFFKVGLNAEQDNVIQYKLNTLPAKSKVLPNMKVKQFSEGYQLNASQFETLSNRLDNIEKWQQENYSIFWTILD